VNLEIHEVQLIQSWHQRRNATAETVARIQKRKKKERKKERKKEKIMSTGNNIFLRQRGTYQVTRRANARTKVMLPQCRLETSILT
jgi:hypothetical protein